VRFLGTFDRMLTCKSDHFSLPPEVHYLNCAYMSPLARKVEEAGIEGMRRKRVPAAIVAQDFFEGLDTIRGLFARLVNVSNDSRIAVIPSASYGLASAANNIQIEATQNIVVLGQQFPSNVYIWRRRARETGAKLRTVAAPAETRDRAEAWNAALYEAIDRDTAVVALPQVHWTDGTVFDLERVGSRARDVGAALVVDGTQSVGAMPFDVARIAPDALVCAAYKWLLGPYSIGVAYMGARFDGGAPLEETWIAREGSRDFHRLVDYQDSYREGAVRYDAGEASNFILVPMLVAALELLLGWSVAEIQEYCRALTDRLTDSALQMGCRVEALPWRAGHLIGLRAPPGRHPAELLEECARRRISISARGDVLRVSPYVYNDEQDIDALRGALADVWGGVPRT